MEAVEVRLPRGFSARGGWYRNALVRPVCGRDEAFFWEANGFASHAARITALLARCLVRLGPYTPVGEAPVRELCAGDREALLLDVRRLTFGEKIACVLRCPAERCDEKMDLDLTVSGLLMPEYATAAESHEAFVEGRRVRFRVPNGGDQEAAALLASEDPAGASEFLLRRCVLEVDGEVPGPLPEPLRRALPARIAEADPQAEILLDLSCPACSRAFTAPFDAGAYLFTELETRRRDLYRDVHHLAFHYHWSETEILGMSPRKRRLYLELLGDALAETRTV